MILYDLDELNKIDLEDIPNLRFIVPILYKYYFIKKKCQNIVYFEYSADDFDTITSLLNIDQEIKIFSLENEVFDNDFIIDELQDQINTLRIRK